MLLPWAGPSPRSSTTVLGWPISSGEPARHGSPSRAPWRGCPSGSGGRSLAPLPGAHLPGGAERDEHEIVYARIPPGGVSARGGDLTGRWRGTSQALAPFRVVPGRPLAGPGAARLPGPAPFFFPPLEKKKRLEGLAPEGTDSTASPSRPRPLGDHPTARREVVARGERRTVREAGGVEGDFAALVGAPGRGAGSPGGKWWPGWGGGWPGGRRGPLRPRPGRPPG